MLGSTTNGYFKLPALAFVCLKLVSGTLRQTKLHIIVYTGTDQVLVAGPLFAVEKFFQRIFFKILLLIFWQKRFSKKIFSKNEMFFPNFVFRGLLGAENIFQRNIFQNFFLFFFL